jgi:tetratricopeptide (TPR) repeat protein
VKPTDSAFWRDPRIRPLLVGRVDDADRRPTTPQEFVTQILAAARTTAPGTGRNETDAAAVARLLLEAILACDKEQAMLEKTAPREQLERLEAELVLLENDNGDPDSIGLLADQRNSLVRSRERIVRLGERRADAAARLEQLWSDTQRLSTIGGDAEAVRALSAQLSEHAAQAARDFPSRTRSTTGRSTAAAALLLLAGIGTARAQSPRAPASAFYDRGQPDSGIAVLAAGTDTSAPRWTLEGRLELQRAAQGGGVTRITAARRARIAFERAAILDTAATDAREQLVWLYRLLPWFLGGSRDKSMAMLDTLDVRAPYRAELLRGYLARLNGDARTAAVRFRNLTIASPDSAGAWFALGDLAAKEERLDEARTALARYRALRPDDRAALFHIGMLSAEHGVDLAEGEAALRWYVAGKPRPDEPLLDMAWWRLGQVFEKQGRTADAKRAYGEAIRIDPKYAKYRESLAGLTAQPATP